MSSEGESGGDSQATKLGAADVWAFESSTELKITPKEAVDLIRAQTPTALLTLLKKLDHAESSGRIFAGYRVNADSLKLPLIRGRLVSELVTNSKLLDALLALPHPPAVQQSAPSPPKDGEPKAPTQGKPNAPGNAETQRIAELAAERDALRLQLREARVASSELQIAEATTRRLLSVAQSEIGELRAKLLAEQAAGASRERRLKRLEREAAEAKQHAVSLERQRQAVTASATRQYAGSKPAHAGEDSAAKSERELAGILFDALERLYSRGKYEPARLLADEMLHGDPGNPDALRIRALTRLAQGDRPAALHDLRAIFEGCIARHETLRAAHAMLHWMDAAGLPDAKMAHALYALTSRESAPMIADVRDALLAIRERSPEQYDTLRSWCQPPLASALFTSGEAPGERLQLPPQFVQLAAQSLTGLAVSARGLVAAVNRGDRAAVESARLALPKLDKRSREQTLFSITEAAGGDESYARLLARRTLAETAIIDASNVAHYERELMPSTRPLLSNIVAVQRALRERGFFPILTIADANLPHVIDAPGQLRGLVTRGEVELVTGGTVADETIIREARRLNAVIVSNDYMADWDPAGEIAKLQYSISLTDGRANLYE